MIKTIPIEQVDCSTTIRERDPEHVARLIEAIGSGVDLPPIEVREVSPENFLIRDGNHRLGACESLGHTTIAAEVKTYEGHEAELEFRLDCYRANTDHGLRLSTKQRDGAIFTLSEQQIGKRKPTYEEIGSAFGLTRQRVAQIVKQQRNAETNAASTSEKGAGKYSPMGAFRAAAKRMHRQLGQAQDLLEAEHQDEVRDTLEGLRNAIEEALRRGDRLNVILGLSTTAKTEG